MAICPACKTSVNVGPREVPNTPTLEHWVCYPCHDSIGDRCYFITKKVNKMNQYMILRNPTTYNNSSPKKFFDTLEQATTVAKKMALEHRDTFYVIKLVRKISLPEIVLNVEDL